MAVSRRQAVAQSVREWHWTECEGESKASRRPHGGLALRVDRQAHRMMMPMVVAMMMMMPMVVLAAAMACAT